MFQTPEELAQIAQEEYDLFMPVFKDNKPMIKALRKTLLGIDVTPQEKELIKLIPEEVENRISKLLLPIVNGNEDIHFVNDFWFQFNLKDRSEFQVNIDIEYLPLVLNLFESGLQRLKGKKGELSISDMTYSKTESKEKNIINTIARNVVLATIEGTLASIYHKANNKPLTVDQIKERQKQNSSK
jgi:hypothetical protein